VDSNDNREYFLAKAKENPASRVFDLVDLLVTSKKFEGTIL
jgi:hypothetical protein